MEISIIYILKAFILPPGINILLVLTGLLLLVRSPVIGRLLILISIISLYLLSTDYISIALAKHVETVPPLQPITQNETDRQAIVVLGGGRRNTMPEYGKSVPVADVLERLRYGMHLQRQTGLPILLSGGRIFPKLDSEAEVMDQVLISDFKIKAKWLEDKSRNTAQNALNSYAMLEREEIGRIYLVTHALHMPRATDMFTSAGFDVTPAPTIFISEGKDIPLFMQWIPKATAFLVSRNLLHEMLGYWWYRMRHQ